MLAGKGGRAKAWPPLPHYMELFSRLVDLTSEELAGDQSFQSYVFRKNEDDIRFWEAFVARHPQKQNDIDEAVEILTLLAFRKHTTTAKFRKSELNRLTASLSALQTSHEIARFEKDRRPVRRGFSNFIPRFLSTRRNRIAGFTGLLLILSAAFFTIHPYIGDAVVNYETQYGENLTILLPDSSVVILNGNTRLALYEGWNSESDREVWLDGEAFFEVKNKGISGNARFIVHTRGMDVEVLGTRFNVFNRDDKANVVLNSGKVELKIPFERDTTRVLMKPDESIEFSKKDQTIVKKQVNAELATSWRNKVLVFRNTPLYEIGEIIEHAYGLKVVFDETVNKHEALEGTIPAENLEILLMVLAKSSNLNITRNKNQITIEKLDSLSTQP